MPRRSREGSTGRRLRGPKSRPARARPPKGCAEPWLGGLKGLGAGQAPFGQQAFGGGMPGMVAMMLQMAGMMRGLWRCDAVNEALDWWERGARDWVARRQADGRKRRNRLTRRALI